MHSGPKETDENGWGGLLYLFLTVIARLYGGNNKKRYPDLKTKQRGHHLGAASLEQYALQKIDT